jgi:hypothetical protein
MINAPLPTHAISFWSRKFQGYKEVTSVMGVISNKKGLLSSQESYRNKETNFFKIIFQMYKSPLVKKFIGEDTNTLLL